MGGAIAQTRFAVRPTTERRTIGRSRLGGKDPAGLATDGVDQAERDRVQAGQFFDLRQQGLVVRIVEGRFAEPSSGVVEQLQRTVADPQRLGLPFDPSFQISVHRRQVGRH